MRGRAQARKKALGQPEKAGSCLLWRTLQIFLHGLLSLAKQGYVILASRVVAGQEKSQASGATQALTYLLSLVCFYSLGEYGF